jgi:hypothetical protein
MRRFLSKVPQSLSLLSMFIAIALISSFGLHSIQITHIHPDHPDHSHHHDQGAHEHGGSMISLGEYAHMAEKKTLYTLIAVTLAAFIFVSPFGASWATFLLCSTIRQITFVRQRKRTSYSFLDFLTLAFSKGILNPQLH